MTPLATAENIKSLAALLAASRKAKTPAGKMAVWDNHLTEIVERIAPSMTPKEKLTTAIATGMVDRLVALKEQYDADVRAIYAEADSYPGRGNSNVIRDALKARNELREAQYTAAALLESFDAEDEAA